jgi:hypothetical protein
VSPELAAALMNDRGEFSVSFLQRQYLLGYSDALRLMDQVKLAGLLSGVGAGDNRDNLRRFVAAVRGGLGPKRLELTGATLYSEPFSLARGGTYILGTNPGGSPEGKEKLAAVLVRLERGEPATVPNDYLDDTSWDTPQSRQLQETVRALLHLVAPGNERRVCAANLIYVRSRTMKELQEHTDGFWQLADACWPGHEVVLDAVQPKLVITYGNGAGSAYDYVAHRLRKLDVIIEPPRDAGWGRTKLKSFSYAARWGRVRVIGLPHPSRYGLLAAEPTRGSVNAEWPTLRPQVSQFITGE